MYPNKRKIMFKSWKKIIFYMKNKHDCSGVSIRNSRGSRPRNDNGNGESRKVVSIKKK